MATTDPRRPVSRILFPINRAATISLGQPLPAASMRPTREHRSEHFCSLLGLAPGGGCLADAVTSAAGGLLLRLFTLTSSESEAYCFLWPCSAGSLRLGVTQHRAQWSSDFPRAARNRPRLPGLLGVKASYHASRGASRAGVHFKVHTGTPSRRALRRNGLRSRSNCSLETNAREITTSCSSDKADILAEVRLIRSL